MKNYLKDIYNFFRLKTAKTTYQIGFFCENNYIFQYLEPYILKKLKKNKILIITFENIISDRIDYSSIFIFKTKFFQELVFLTLKLKFLYSSTPNIENTIFKKSKFSKCKYIYLQHGAVSTTMIYDANVFDKFDAIPGYNTQPDIETFKQVVKNVGCAIIGQTPSLAPADKKLYSIRDIVGTVESLPLITSSILSKKIASGLNSLVLDVKVGNGSFNTTEEIARSLANSLVSVAQDAGIKCEAILTDMNQVLGHSAGHALEMKESIGYLTNSFKNPRLEKITNELATSLLVQSYDYSKEEAILKINSAVNSGKAAEKFEMMVSALGGDKNILSNYNNLLGSSNFRGDILSNTEGYVTKIKTRKLGLILIEMGGGRKKITDKIDYSVGFINVTSLNDEIQSGKPLLSVYTKSENDFKKLEKDLTDCFVIENKQITNKTIIDIIN